MDWLSKAKSSSIHDIATNAFLLHAQTRQAEKQINSSSKSLVRCKQNHRAITKQNSDTKKILLLKNLPIMLTEIDVH